MELVVIKESDQSRRELCEECEHSRGHGPSLRCLLKRNASCAHLAALQDPDANCPRNDEKAVIWKAARRDPGGPCGANASPSDGAPPGEGSATSQLRGSGVVHRVQQGAAGVAQTNRRPEDR